MKNRELIRAFCDLIDELEVQGKESAPLPPFRQRVVARLQEVHGNRARRNIGSAQQPQGIRQMPLLRLVSSR